MECDSAWPHRGAGANGTTVVVKSWSGLVVPVAVESQPGSRFHRARCKIAWRRRSRRQAIWFCQAGFAPSVRERIRAHLQLEHAGLLLGAVLGVEDRAGAGRGPQPAALPAAARIVDAAIDVLGEEAERVGHAQIDELAVH